MSTCFPLPAPGRGCGKGGLLCLGGAAWWGSVVHLQPPVLPGWQSLCPTPCPQLHGLECWEQGDGRQAWVLLQGGFWLLALMCLDVLCQHRAVPGSGAEMGLCLDRGTRGCPLTPCHPSSFGGFNVSLKSFSSSGCFACECRACLYHRLHPSAGDRAG